MKLLKTTFLTALLAMFTLAVAAQMQDPVHFKVSQKKVSPTELEVIFTADRQRMARVFNRTAC